MDGKGQRNTSPEKVKNNVFCLIRLKGLSEVEAAKNADVANGYFSWMKKSAGYPDLQKLLKICDALNTPIEDVLYKDYSFALEQKEVAAIDKEIARLKKRRDDLTSRMVKRAKEHAAALEAAEQGGGGGIIMLNRGEGYKNRIQRPDMGIPGPQFWRAC